MGSPMPEIMNSCMVDRVIVGVALYSYTERVCRFERGIATSAGETVSCIGSLRLGAVIVVKS